MDKYSLSSLDVACQNALQVLVKPRYYHLIEPWLMNAKEQYKRSLIMAANYVEGKSWGTLLPAVQKNQAYAFLLHPVALAKIEDWQVTEGTAEEKTVLAGALRSLMVLRETLPGYDEKSIPSGLEPTDRLYLDSYCRRIRAGASSGDLPELSGRETLTGKANRVVRRHTPHSHYLESHLYFPFSTVDFTTTNERMMRPPPADHGRLDSPAKDTDTERLKSSLISPIILSEKLAMQ
ncbi:hypothetical protein TGME49_270820 [Toxoplasma gondii ME49]|uniref:Uncharacterized protein n=2 Tax=Toxoplasma gondii TaxID=5811 RepID=S8F1H2_TOXGM|nr:hypothetical protein TGME49_270820 [Toxoplasma gondii ME49]EPT28452.1 hypothetical protein TGME49_270820 [Toxoplasma gondii ME49]KYF46827.1 hypothetical protein TGARI_270820 [Toxoplasma gondii ARI]|eukprot:XP_002365748.1 hypothetical protein TGME49_270820 [Toxoplasma gondii ME49]